MAGVVDSAQGSSRYQPYFDWHDVQLGNMLETKLGVLTIIDNDVNTLTMSEKLYGAGRGVSDFLTITIGRGIGLGIVADGKLYRGSRGGGGEFGHMVIDETGPMCDCGKRGCDQCGTGTVAGGAEARRSSHVDWSRCWVLC